MTFQRIIGYILGNVMIIGGLVMAFSTPLPLHTILFGEIARVLFGVGICLVIWRE